LRTLTLLHLHCTAAELGGIYFDARVGLLCQDKDPEVRAFATYLLGVRRGGSPSDLLRGLSDQDALVRRRACEALICADLEPPLEKLWPLLSDSDRFVRHAARLVLERIDAKK